MSAHRLGHVWLRGHWGAGRGEETTSDAGAWLARGCAEAGRLRCAVKSSRLALMAQASSAYRPIDS